MYRDVCKNKKKWELQIVVWCNLAAIFETSELPKARFVPKTLPSATVNLVAANNANARVIYLDSNA